jgi:hypothetical protein
MTNFSDFVDLQIMNNKRYDNLLWSGTNYSNVLELISGDSNNSEITYVIFITDGDNSDKNETETIIKRNSRLPIFFQFVGIGSQQFRFLEKLDTMLGRIIDNANFFQVNDISAISDDELYSRLFNEFPNWIKEARKAGIVK